MTGYSNCISYIVEAKKQGLGSRKIAKGRFSLYVLVDEL